MNTGALGHGLPICVGMALAGKLDAAPYRVFTLLGDGELAEGSNWEAAMAAAHYELDNLTAILDHNTLQITGHTRDVCSNEPVDEKFAAFGWDVRTVDGHDFAALTDALTAHAGSRQADVRHRQHGEGPRRELHGERREVAPRRAQRRRVRSRPSPSSNERRPSWRRSSDERTRTFHLFARGQSQSPSGSA